MSQIKTNSNFQLDANKDWNDFVEFISHNTGKKSGELWDKFSRANRKRERRWVCEELLDTGIGKTAVIIGASPKLKDQTATLRSLRKDDRFLFFAVSSGLRFLLKNDIRPHYTLVMEADETVSRFFKDIGDTSGITLVYSNCVSPNILNMWKSEMQMICIYSAIPGMDKKLKKWYTPVNGCGVLFSALCSQYNTALAIAYRVLGSRSFIFVGNELSFPTNDANSHYYVDREDIKDGWERMPHPDIYGKTVYTTYNFMTLKLALEDYLQRLFVECVNYEGRIPYFINASEGGIFGVSKRNGNLSIKSPSGDKHTILWQLNLDMAIRQAGNIMKYGKPITEQTIIKRPSMQQIYAYA